MLGGTAPSPVSAGGEVALGRGAGAQSPFSPGRFRFSCPWASRGGGGDTHSPVSPERGELLSHPGGCDTAGGTCCSPPGLPIFAPLPPHIPVIVTVLSPGGGGTDFSMCKE
ncbi:hypothetical protein Q9966_004711 [Columba livia]|nr:hypothetical protein Q9966_004711 [Columba livia]